MNKQTNNLEEERPKQIEAYFQKFAVANRPNQQHSAHWHSDLALFKADITQQFSLDQKVGFEVNSEWYLYPEEAVYLFYKGKIKVNVDTEEAKREEDHSETEKPKSYQLDNGLSLLQLIYGEKRIDNMYLGMHIWRCYEFLRRNSFHVKRDSQPLDIDKLKGGVEEIVKKVKGEQAISTREPFCLKPVFRVYDTNQNYAKDRVSFYLLIMPLQEETFSLDALAKIRESFKPRDRLRLGLVDEEEVIVYDMKELEKKTQS